MPLTTRCTSRLVLLALVSLGLVWGGATVAAARTASPTLEGPVTGGRGAPFLATTAFDLTEVGYSQAEYFISGTATAYTNGGDLASDGRWKVIPGATAAYRTRVLVYRPSNPKNFKGTVVVEWLNVSGGLDAAADWLGAHEVHAGHQLRRVGPEYDHDPLDLIDRALRADGVLQERPAAEISQQLRSLPEPRPFASGQDQARIQAGTSWIRPPAVASRPPS